MRVIRGERADVLATSAVTLGMFDGVHRGHQALLRACRSHADRLGVPAVALTYEPHPQRILHPEMPIHLLTPLPEKLERLAASAMDVVLVADFTRDFSLLSPKAFLCDVLVSALHPRVVVAGYRTTFGHSRAGSAEVLIQIGKELGVEVEVVPPIEIEGAPVSSTRIRHALDQGDVRLAGVLLSYNYRLTGMVTRGDGRGHQLGVPTANLEVDEVKLIPADGVYVVDAEAPGVKRRAVMNIGARPTFNRPRSLEVHLLDFHADLYGLPLTVSFLTRLRDIRPFPDVQSLLIQIAEDIAQAKRI